MNLLDLNSRIPPYQHQIVGVQKIVANPYFFLTDEMGAGKTKQIIDSACLLWMMEKIDRVLIIAPASIRPVWFNEEFGELKKHLWNNIPSSVTEFHQKVKVWRHGPKEGNRLRWVVTNYDYIRKGFEGKGKKKKPIGKLAEIMGFCTPRTLLVLDESSAVAHNTSKQTKACYAIRQRCGRVVLLNGTPVGQSPADLYAQGNILSPSILQCRSFTHFRARYAVMGGFENHQIVGWIKGAIEDIQQRFAPYTIRREKKNCIDLPEKLPPVIMPVAMTPVSWKAYKEMKNDLVAWLNDNQVSTASVAITKVLRLAQITSGFVGGIEDAMIGQTEAEPAPSWLPLEDIDKDIERVERYKQHFPVKDGVAQIGTEKLEHFLEWFTARLEEKPTFKLVFWCRFLSEVSQTLEAVKLKFPHVTVAALTGKNTKEEREYVLRLLDPRTTPDKPIFVAGTLGTGSMGLNFTAADTNWYRSLPRSRRILEQSKDRTHRPGQINPVSYFYQVATGPNGQKTIDHLIVNALQGLTDLANLTTSAWVKALNEE
jgi:SNF2 domain-containing protein/helicase-like protein